MITNDNPYNPFLNEKSADFCGFHICDNISNSIDGGVIRKFSIPRECKHRFDSANRLDDNIV